VLEGFHVVAERVNPERASSASACAYSVISLRISFAIVLSSPMGYALAEPKEISTYLSPRRPSVLIEYRESFLMMLRVSLFTFMTTVTCPSGCDGICLHLMWVPLTAAQGSTHSMCTSAKGLAAWPVQDRGGETCRHVS